MRLFTLLPGQRAKRLRGPLDNNSVNKFALYFCMELRIHYATDISAFSQPHPRSTKVIKRRCTNLNRDLTHKYLMHIKRSRVFYHIYKTTSCNVSILLLSMNFLLIFTMFKNSGNTPDTKISKWAAQNWLYISTMPMNQGTGLISLKRGAYNLTPNLNSSVTLTLTGGLECSRIMHRTESICRLAQSTWTRNTVNTMVLRSYNES